MVAQGLARVQELYEDRSRRARDLREEGQPVVGYMCIYPVLEMMTAAGMAPYRVFGAMDEPITKADSCLPTVVCPFLRSALDLGLKGRYGFLNGMVMCHSCEVGEKLAHIWRTYLEHDYFHYVDVPHTIHQAAQEQYRQQLQVFKETLEAFTGKEITAERLTDAIRIHNQQRGLVRELYDLSKPDPPLLSGTERLRVMVVLMSIPVDEGNQLLQEVIAEIKRREGGPYGQPARLLVWGSIIDDTPLIEMMESAGANVVMDDTCVGSRAYFPDVEPTGDPLDGLARRYLVEVRCPRTFRGDRFDQSTKDYMSDLEARFGYLRDYARDWKVNGVVLQSVRYCDIHGYEVPGLRDYLDSLGIPSIYIEHDYTRGALAPLRTRVQAFIEMVSQAPA